MLIPGPKPTVRIYMLLSPDNLAELSTSIYEAPSYHDKPRRDSSILLAVIERRLANILYPCTMTIREVDWIIW